MVEEARGRTEKFLGGQFELTGKVLEVLSSGELIQVGIAKLDESQALQSVSSPGRTGELLSDLPVELLLPRLAVLPRDEPHLGSSAVLVHQLGQQRQVRDSCIRRPALTPA
ncbi:MAG: hypothetical protein HY815_33140 [Candidatus Riflebacteria bacterium]|nr:hypothetical protein [Candidatus Riflebacteria bacterium]